MKSLYLGRNLFLVGLTLVCLFLLSWKLEALLFVAQLGLVGLLVFIVFDLILLYSKKAIEAKRIASDKFSNGDFNPIELQVKNHYDFKIFAEIIDEIPIEFQKRDIQWKLNIKSHSDASFHYQLKPVKRGVYDFGAIHIFAKSYLGFFKRRYSFQQHDQVSVYPSYLQMRKYELAAFAKRYFPIGLKKIRKIGHTMEFEQIKNYVPGDDPRHVNWKASAKRNELMVNQFQDQKSQSIYSVIDKGRLMKMPFEEMTLLDYAINATLAINNIAIKKGDKAGVLTFGYKMSGFLPASTGTKQMIKTQEFLYNQKTLFKESSFEMLQSFTKRKIAQRSLMLIYTNFETKQSLLRQIDYLRSMAKKHLVVVIFFKNTTLTELVQTKPSNIREVYHQTIGEQQFYEKNIIVKELKKYGIHGILTTPSALTVDTINTYLKIKAQGLL